MSDLTQRQGETLIRIFDYLERNHMPPTIREISEEMGCTSRNGCDFSFKQLAKKGYITSRAGAARCHIITQQGRDWVASSRDQNAVRDKA